VPRFIVYVGKFQLKIVDVARKYGEYLGYATFIMQET
jgi:hypothetical protein